MDIADRPDKQIRNPNAWMAQIFQFVSGYFQQEKQYSISLCPFFLCMASKLGLQFLGEGSGADLVSLFLKSKSGIF